MSELIVIAIIIVVFLTWQHFVRLKKSNLSYRRDRSGEKSTVKQHDEGSYIVIERVGGIERHLKFAPNKEAKIDFKEPKDILCPYCKYRFPKMPARSLKCPKCKEYIYRVKDYENEIYQLLTVKEYKKKAKIEADKQWMEYSAQIKQYSKTGDYKGLSYTYWMMALHLYEEGKDFIPLLQQSFRFELLEYQQVGCKYVIEHYDGKKGKTYSIEEALNNKCLPCKTMKDVDWHDIGYFEPVISRNK